MIRLSTKSRYGTRLMINLALNYQNQPTILKAIAEDEDVSTGYLEQIIIPLKNNGLVRSIRGVGGGFVLTRPPNEIKMSEIINVLEGSWDLVECVGDDSYCQKIKQCATYDLWKVLTESLTGILDKTTLQDLVKTHKKKNK